MRIYLYDLKKDKDFEVKLNIEYVLPSKDLFVLFVNRDEVCGLMRDGDSAPYDEFYLRKINHIIQGNIDHDGKEIDVTIGFYLAENNFQAFLISHNDPSGHISLQSSTYYDENYYRDQFIFNYAEYAEIQVVGLEKLSFDEYVKKIINDRIDRSQNLLYNIHRGDKTVRNFASEKGMHLFLQEEELKEK